MPPRGEDISEKVTATSNEISQHFKNVGLRKAEFKRQKSVLIEKELQAHFKAEHEAARAEAASTTRRPLPRSQAKTPERSSPAEEGDQGVTRSMSSPSGSLGFTSQEIRISRPSTPGAVVSRFGAAVPMSNHPSVHPGAISRFPSQGRTGSSIGSRPPRGAASGAELPRTNSAVMPDMARSFSMQSQPLSGCGEGASPSGVPDLGLSLPSASRGRSRTESSNQAQYLGSPTARPETPSSPSVHVRRSLARQRSTLMDSGTLGVSFSGTLEMADSEELLWGEEMSREEQLFIAAEEEAAALSAFSPGGVLGRQPDPPDMIERLGDLMALLGPRYRTLPREEVWQKAVVGNTTPLQRLEKRLGYAAAHSISGFKKPGGRGRTGKNKHRSPERAPNHDPDGKARGAWLKARDNEDEKKPREGTYWEMVPQPVKLQTHASSCNKCGTLSFSRDLLAASQG